MGPFRLSSPDLKQLRIFVSIVEHEGVSAAAAALGTSLTTVSRALSDLESRFGIRLCQRGRGGFLLTPQGNDIYTAACRMFEELTEFETSVRVAARAVKGRLRVGVIDNTISNPGSILIGALRELALAYPDIFVELSIMAPSVIEVAVRERRLDVGITAQPMLLRPLEYTEAFVEEHRMYAARTGPCAERLAALAPAGELPEGMPYIARRYRAALFDTVERRYGLRVVATVDNVEAVAILVASGLGVGLLPSHYVARFPGFALEEVPLPEAPLRAPFFVFHRQDTSHEPGVRAFLRLLGSTVH